MRGEGDDYKLNLSLPLDAHFSLLNSTHGSLKPRNRGSPILTSSTQIQLLEEGVHVIANLLTRLPCHLHHTLHDGARILSAIGLTRLDEVPSHQSSLPLPPEIASAPVREPLAKILLLLLLLLLRQTTLTLK